MAETERKIVFWDCEEHAERLMHTDIGEAVYDWADSIARAALPELVTVYGYARMELPSTTRLAERALEYTLEYLDEEFGSPDAGYTEATEKMREAALAFAETVCDGYESWACEQVTSETVRVADYVPSEWMTAPAEATHAD